MFVLGGRNVRLGETLLELDHARFQVQEPPNGQTDLLENAPARMSDPTLRQTAGGQGIRLTMLPASGCPSPTSI